MRQREYINMTPEEFKLALKSGMFWVYYPEATGTYEDYCERVNNNQPKLNKENNI